jgi:putative endonuclease
MRKLYDFYILASRRNGTLYIGITNDLGRRVRERREGLIEGFTRRYAVNRLVYFETFQDVSAAIHRKTRLKKWKRQWKIESIRTDNLEWIDLYQKVAMA